MSRPIRHHYVPQFYLTAWCTDRGGSEGKRLWVVRNYGGKIKYVTRAPKAVGFQDHLYSFTDDLPEEDKAKLETEFFQPLDTRGSDLVAKLIADQRLDAEERILWAKFLVAMRLRTPKNIAVVKETGRKAFFEEIGSGQAEWEKIRDDGDPESVLDYVELLHPGITNNFGLSNVPALGGKIVAKIDKMTWNSLNFGDGKHRLMSSDTPCVFTAGIADPNCIVAIPLSPQHGFIAFYPGSQAEAALKRRGPTAIAAALNQNVVGQAVQDAYCVGRTDAPDRFFEKFLSSAISD